MTDEPDGDDPGRPPTTSITRRMVLKVAGLVSLLSDAPGAVAESAGATDAEQASRSTAPAVATGVTRTATVDGSLGRDARAVALDGSTALVGAPPASHAAGPTVGRAAVLTRTDGRWTREAVLSPDGESGQFGRAVALDGDTAVVGGELGPDPTGDHAGSTTVFERDGDEWTRRAALGAPGADGVDLFGTAVDVADDTLLVGASAAAAGTGRRAGAAFAFSRIGETWRRVGRLGPRASEVTEFGRAVAIDGDTAVVGARRAGPPATESGVAVVFRRYAGRWRREAELTPPERGRDDGFGTAVATSDETVVVGAPGETNALGTNAGAAHVFARRNGRWRRQATLRPETGATAHRFGAAITLDGDVALVGTAAGGGPFLFGRVGDSWPLVATVRAEGGGPDGPGTEVALDGVRALVGITDRRTDAERPTGAVEVFEL